MQISGNTILITGATSGIGLALAERFDAAGSRVLICGRRADRLASIAAQHPNMRTHVCDVSNPDERIALAEWARSEAPEINVLLNNAGIQRRIPLPTDEPWDDTATEIRTNFDAVVHLSSLFLPILAGKPRAAIVNVSSGLAFAPLAIAPVYSATKAAVHSFTVSLRAHARKSGVDVIEIIPPAVATDLGGPGLHNADTPLSEFADAVMAQLAEGKQEVAYGFSERMRDASRADLDAAQERMNGHL